MEDNVMKLLAAEKKVNTMVNKAQADKNSLLMSIKKEADIQVEAYRVEAEQEYEKNLARVSRYFNFIQCLILSVK